MTHPRTTRRETREMAAQLVEALVDGPVTEYGLADLLGLRGGDRLNRSRAWLDAFNERGLLEAIGERPNPSGARKGTHPVYRLKLPQ